MTNKIAMNESVFVHAKQWFDKTGGNSYFSARIYVNGKCVALCPFQYGYESQYEYSAIQALKDTGHLPDDFNAPLWALEREGVAVYTVIYEAKKADVKRWAEVTL